MKYTPLYFTDVGYYLNMRNSGQITEKPFLKSATCSLTSETVEEKLTTGMAALEIPLFQNIQPFQKIKYLLVPIVPNF